MKVSGCHDPVVLQTVDLLRVWDYCSGKVITSRREDGTEGTSG
jgi:hypothetical protein